jgi:HD-GYP domain-containing protein (c-di-GMP phosphodiesterase class II)
VRWVSLRTIKPDRVLAQSIMDERGRVLLAQGMVLSVSMVHKLQSIGVCSVCIEDAITDDISAHEFISPQTKQAVLETTYNALNEIANGSFTKQIRPTRIKQKFRPLLEEVIGQLKEVGGAGEHFGTVYLSDGELYHHSVNVTLFALSVGIGLSMSESDLIDLGVGTLLHDVGKLRIPETILKKPGKLTSDEFEHIKLHTNYGYELLKEIQDLSVPSALVALEHHERVDGTGYPRGLKGPEMHYFSRITGVVDVYEALTANRVYRTAFLPHQAFELLLGGGGTQFDPMVIDSFIRTIVIYPVGMTLLLSTGDRAVVTQSRRKQTQRPVVRVIEDGEGNPYYAPYEVDLAKELTIQIIGCES